MTAKRSTSHKIDKRPGQQSGFNRLLLVLSLLPLAAGLLMITAWALDIIIWNDPQIQLILALLLIFLSFSLSNAAQKNWLLAIGWLLLAASDLVLSFSLNLYAQIAALVVGGCGLILLAIEFFRRWRRSHRMRAH